MLGRATWRGAVAMAAGAAIIGTTDAPAWARGRDTCVATAVLQKKAAELELKEDLKERWAACLNTEDRDERNECMAEAWEEYREGRELARDQFDARLDLCDLLGGGVYDPDIDPSDFSTEIDNPLFPLPVGATWTYEGDTEDGPETIVVTVLEETREIMGVECVSVQDTVMIDGEVVEDTTDWYAQDAGGNVWYFGEISFNYEDGWVADVEGSWLAGEDGAKPGIVMLADPVVGTTYRQEWLLGEAEDAATVLDDNATVEIDLGVFMGCVQTEDFLPPDPDALEHKFYAPGIGFIYEENVEDGETVELVDYTLP